MEGEMCVCVCIHVYGGVHVCVGVCSIHVDVSVCGVHMGVHMCIYTMCGAVVCTNGPTHTASYRQLHHVYSVQVYTCKSCSQS